MFCNFKLFDVIVLLIFEPFVLCKYGCKRKRKEKKRKETKNSENVCVCFLYLFYECFIYFLIYDKIAKIKEEFNILIGSW